MATTKSSVLALYRASLRESQKLFDPVLRDIFAGHIRARFRKNVRIVDEKLRYTKIKTAKSRLKHLRDTNAGTKAGIAWALEFAYGVTGPLKSSNLKALKDLGAPYNRASGPRPPPFHPALRTLLSHHQARRKLSAKMQVNKPVALELLLQQRGWLGKLPARRENNLWWDWWRTELTKIHVPTEIEVKENSSISSPQNAPGLPDASSESDSAPLSTAAKRYGLGGLKSQGAGLAHIVEQLAINHARPNPPRRSPERLKEISTKPVPTPTLPLHNRYYRRRYRDVLARMPFLSFTPTPSAFRPPSVDPELKTKPAKAITEKDNSTTPTTTLVTAKEGAAPVVVNPVVVPGNYNVWVSPWAATRGNSRPRNTYSVMSDEDRAWVQRAEEAEPTTTTRDQGKRRA